MTLADYITENLNRPFIWGQNDCVLFAIGWMRIATGKNYLAGIDRWSSALDAQRILKAGGGLEAMANRQLEPIFRNFAVDGDIALHDGCLRLFSGHHIVGPGENGLVFFDRMEAKCAWRCA